MKRAEFARRARAREAPWDVLVIGGGASGAGVAVDAASRGYDTLLVERHDFGKGTSSRSTKLAHGGVRYLQQGNLSLVMEALRERGRLRANAPHLVSALSFIVPSYAWWERPFYGTGLKLYQALSGRHGFGPSRWLSKEETLRRLPGLKREGLRGGVEYYDGQFDDCRLLIHLLATAADLGATVLNYAEVTGLTRDGSGTIAGAQIRDALSGETWTARAKVVINATGPFVDSVREMGDSSSGNMVVTSQGSHVVLDGSFLPGDAALMVPRTRDGRVLFAIPWRGHTLVGTTDIPVDGAAMEPRATEEEVEFILSTAALYLERKPTRADILSVFAGIRPLARSGDSRRTAALSRDHVLRVESGGLVTLTGGKWTTYRRMAEQCVDEAARVAKLPERPSRTKDMPVHGSDANAARFGDLSVYGADAPAVSALIQEDPKLGERLHPALPDIGAQIVWAAREEMAMTVEDALARRSRALFLNAKAALEMAPRAAELMARELGRDASWQAAQVEEFRAVAAGYAR
jgi:glycerol-3-phosphate dehydrogenase